MEAENLNFFDINIKNKKNNEINKFNEDKFKYDGKNIENIDSKDKEFNYILKYKKINKKSIIKNLNKNEKNIESENDNKTSDNACGNNVEIHNSCSNEKNENIEAHSKYFNIDEDIKNKIKYDNIIKKDIKNINETNDLKKINCENFRNENKLNKNILENKKILDYVFSEVDDKKVDEIQKRDQSNEIIKNIDTINKIIGIKHEEKEINKDEKKYIQMSNIKEEKNIVASRKFLISNEKGLYSNETTIDIEKKNDNNKIYHKNDSEIKVPLEEKIDMKTDKFILKSNSNNGKNIKLTDDDENILLSNKNSEKFKNKNIGLENKNYSYGKNSEDSNKSIIDSEIKNNLNIDNKNIISKSYNKYFDNDNYINDQIKKTNENGKSEYNDKTSKTNQNKNYENLNQKIFAENKIEMSEKNIEKNYVNNEIKSIGKNKEYINEGIEERKNINEERKDNGKIINDSNYEKIFLTEKNMLIKNLNFLNKKGKNEINIEFDEISQKNIEKKYENIIHSKDNNITKVNKYEVINQIVQKASLILKNGTGEIIIKLKPEFLGPLKINIFTENNHISVKILSFNSSVKDLIESNISILKNELNNSGYEINKLDIILPNDNESSRYGKENNNFVQYEKNSNEQENNNKSQNQKQNKSGNLENALNDKGVIDYFV